MILFRASYRFSRQESPREDFPKKRKKRFERELGQQSLFDVLKGKENKSRGEENGKDEDKDASDNEDDNTTEEEEDDATESEEKVGEEQKNV